MTAASVTSDKRRDRAAESRAEEGCRDEIREGWPDGDLAINRPFLMRRGDLRPTVIHPNNQPAAAALTADLERLYVA